MKVRHILCLAVLMALLWYIFGCRPLPTISADAVLAHAKTGDVIFFRNIHKPWYYLTAVPMTHLGVVLVPPGSSTPYILEMHQFRDAPTGYPDVDGPRVYPLEARLREATKPDRRWDLFYAPLRKPLSHAPGMQWAFPAPAYVPYDYDYIRHEAACHFVPFHGRVDVVPGKMHCANYAAMVLRRLGIADPATRIDCITPMDVTVRGVAPRTYGKLLAVTQ